MKPAPRTPYVLRAALAVAFGTSLAAFAQTPPAPTPPAPGAPVTPSPAATTPGSPAAGPAAAAAPRPFKDVIKDAKESKGFFTLWQKDDKVWFEVKPDQLDKPFFLSIIQTNGLGDGRFFGGLMGPSAMVHLKKVGNQMQLIANNNRFRADAKSPTEMAMKTSFSESLIASGAVASAPHPETKAVLVEANAMLLIDIAGAATTLETVYRIPYALDSRNSSLAKAETSDTATGFNTSLHFSVAKLPAPPLVPNPASPQVPPPRNVPDARSLFLGYRLNFAQLPAVPMKPRVADERVGYFTTGFQNLSEEAKLNNNVHYVNRWRLEKKDPSAALSEPVKPIVYWLDKNIPVKHRQAIIDGILVWNDAFERIGFKNAVQAKVQPDDATFDTADINYATVRWYLTSDGGPAIGPSHADPRTGEIVDADIMFTDSFTRGGRRFIVEDAPRAHEAHLPILGGNANFCHFANESHSEAEFAMDILEARGDLDPTSPEADKFVYDYVKEVMTHEVGHTLGLRHNFRSSTVFTAAQLKDPAFTKKNGVVGSVMDYPPFNIPLKGEPKPDYVHPGLGPYDYWAIEYAYKPLDPATEKEELEKIAARGAKETWLAYGTDEDSFIGGSPQGMDPTVNVWDLTDDPLGYYKKRLELSRELWARLQSKELAPGESYDGLRRSFLAGFQQMGRGMLPVTKYIGGVVQLRDRAGSGRLPFTPVPASQQREALKVLNDGLFSVDSFKFKPEFLASLPHSRLDYFDQLVRGNITPQPMVSVPNTVLGLQRTALDQVMSDVVATRISDSQVISKDGTNAFRLSELYDSLQASIWSELKSGKEITPMRRNLQREHLRRVAGSLVRPAGSQPADARSLMRMNAQQLAAELRASQAKPAYSKETRAHLAESLNTLDEALKAPLQRAGV
ncbi:zinc-dependent metalloprotease [Usitatibacter palustris]|uniref:Metallopeptidase n=1 Tax=Usitatibacter palustris TaxID=2732487 RepID=A0A6M4H2W0_9PROT|nr:zinc-dependent metalloprotease [Usitatibacter palustris]QJR13665.1 hypothetical protein DSM104440_00451 [Usitatibacter palustris]